MAKKVPTGLLGIVNASSKVMDDDDKLAAIIAKVEKVREGYTKKPLPETPVYVQTSSGSTAMAMLTTGDKLAIATTTIKEIAVRATEACAADALLDQEQEITALVATNEILNGLNATTTGDIL